MSKWDKEIGSKAQTERVRKLREGLKTYREKHGEPKKYPGAKANPRGEIEEFRTTKRRKWTKANTPHSGATKLKPSRRGMKRKAQPHKTFKHGGEGDVVYYSKQHVPTKAYERKPCRMTSLVNPKGEKRWGVFYGNRTKPQLFKTREAAERFQKECWRTHGFKGLGKMAKAKKATKRKKTSVAARKAKGKHCVYTPSGKLFNCFAEKSSAEKVVKGMNKGCQKRGKPASWAVKSSGR